MARKMVKSVERCHKIICLFLPFLFGIRIRNKGKSEDNFDRVEVFFAFLEFVFVLETEE